MYGGFNSNQNLGKYKCATKRRWKIYKKNEKDIQRSNWRQRLSDIVYGTLLMVRSTLLWWWYSLSCTHLHIQHYRKVPKRKMINMTKYHVKHLLIVSSFSTIFRYVFVYVSVYGFYWQGSNNNFFPNEYECHSRKKKSPKTPLLSCCFSSFRAKIFCFRFVFSVFVHSVPKIH